VICPAKFLISSFSILALSHFSLLRVVVGLPRFRGRSDRNLTAMDGRKAFERATMTLFGDRVAIQLRQFHKKENTLAKPPRVSRQLQDIVVHSARMASKTRLREMNHPLRSRRASASAT